MGRLTNHFDYCDFTECRHYDKELAKKDNCNFIHSSRNQCLEYAVYNKLKEYEDLEEQGLLLKLPCKLYSEVYEIAELMDWDTGREFKGVIKILFDPSMIEKFDKTVFLTKAEAEKALEEMEKKMSDLISRSTLIKAVEADINRCYALRIDGVGALSHFIDQIKEQPTAFDIEAVVKELEANCFWTASTYDEDGYYNDDSEEAVYLDKAIEIVRKGGVK